MAGDHISFSGMVVKAQGNGMFLVRIEENTECSILCTLSGKIRKNSIRILEGDKVKINVSPYDMSKGIIVFRDS